MKKSWIVIGIGVLLGVFVVGQYNKLVANQEMVKQSWSQVDVVLQRRLELIPNLVETVKGYAKHEKDLFVSIAEARAKLAGAKTVQEKIDGNDALGGMLARLLVVVEQYPQLKANESFAKLQDELAGAENRIAVERRNYNQAVQTYNLTVRRFPGNLMAGMFGFQLNDTYFKAAEGAKEAPKVAF